jgi:glycosyltransferase involved in cell wall biosynthesis
MNGNYILWLCSWYPSQANAYDGDFIQRHAQAVALYKKVYVLAIINSTENYTNTITTTGNLTEHIVYYNNPVNNKWQKFVAMNTFMKTGMKTIEQIISSHGKPQLIHNHVVMHAGLLALKAAHIYRVPYIVSEHWTGYLPEAKPNFNDFNFFSKYLWRKVIKKANAITAVSNYLISHLAVLAKRTDITRIANVVNTEIFKPAGNSNTAETKFIHISTAGYQKNITTILKAVEILADSEYNFKLVLICPNADVIIQNPHYNSIKNHVEILSEIPQQKLAGEIAVSNALILFSHYETFGCVIIEAHACGIPTIVSNIPVLHELVNSSNGIIAAGNSPKSLAAAMMQLIEGKINFDKQAIQNTVLQYNYKSIGNQFCKLYNCLTDT